MTLPEEAPEYSLLDETNPRSLINIVPPRLVPVIKETQRRFPKTFFQHENELRRKHDYDDRDERLRLAFWIEYDAAQAANRQMVLGNIYRGCVFNEVWYNFYEKRLDKMVFILNPPKSYTLGMRHILNKGVDRLLEIIQLPVTKPDGTPDTRAIGQILKAFQLVDMRVKGAVIQRVQIQQQSLNFNTDMATEHAKAQHAQLAEMSLEELEILERKVAVMEKSAKKTMGELSPAQQAEILDVTAQEITPETAQLKELHHDSAVDAEYESLDPIDCPDAD